MQFYVDLTNHLTFKVTQGRHDANLIGGFLTWFEPEMGDWPYKQLRCICRVIFGSWYVLGACGFPAVTGVLLPTSPNRLLECYLICFKKYHFLVMVIARYLPPKSMCQFRWI